MIQGEGKGRPSVERLAYAWRRPRVRCRAGGRCRASENRYLQGPSPCTPSPAPRPPLACLVFPRTQSGLLSASFPEEACRGNLADQQKPLAASGLAGAAGLGLCRADAGRFRPQPPLDNCSRGWFRSDNGHPEIGSPRNRDGRAKQVPPGCCVHGEARDTARESCVKSTMPMTAINDQSHKTVLSFIVTELQLHTRHGASVSNRREEAQLRFMAPALARRTFYGVLFARS